MESVQRRSAHIERIERRETERMERIERRDAERNERRETERNERRESERMDRRETERREKKAFKEPTERPTFRTHMFNKSAQEREKKLSVASTQMTDKTESK